MILHDPSGSCNLKIRTDEGTRNSPELLIQQGIQGKRLHAAQKMKKRLNIPQAPLHGMLNNSNF
ncbi:hypothetical protein, partial [Akkermansia sp.]|uniref:hypothetical protein n=2 Tax=Akkermansia sp. TaxID=1872421 RepID=UPI003A8487CE